MKNKVNCDCALDANQAANEQGKSFAKLGYRMIQDMQSIKLRFDRSGFKGKVGLVQALIEMGTNKPDEIVSEAMDITGEHVEAVMREIIMEGENVYWAKRHDGSLELFRHQA